MESEGYLPQQIFNCDDSRLFWKKPKRAYISEGETKMPGHKPMKDRLTLLFCANASGNMKIKPLVLYNFKLHELLSDAKSTRAASP